MRKILSPWCRLFAALLVLPVLLAAAPRGAGPGVLWRFATGGRAIITAPVVGRDGTLYAASADGVLYAVWPNGRGRWSLRVGITTGQVPPARPVVGLDGTSYWNLGGSVVAVGPTGHLRWVFLAAGRGSGQVSWVSRPKFVDIEQVLEAITGAGLQPSMHSTATTFPLLWLTVAGLIAIWHATARSRSSSTRWWSPSCWRHW